MKTLAAAPATPTMSFLQVRQIRSGAWNPRKHFDNVRMAELTESVRTKGILEPILVRPSSGASRYEIVAGERRFRAAQAADLAEIPAIIRDLTDDEVIEIQVVENCQRSDLHPIEEAEGYARLIATGRFDVARIAERVGCSVGHVYDRLRMLQLTEPARDLFIEDRISAGHAVILSRLSHADQARAMDPDKGGLWSPEALLWGPDEREPDREPLKARTARELQAWVDQHIKFNPQADDVPTLFPETAATLSQAVEEAEKVVPITHDYQIPKDARDGHRVLTERSWKRADGKAGSKPCPSSVTGLIVVGYGRGEAFKVCINKQGCSIHWGKELRAAKKRAAMGLTPGAKSEGKDRWEVEREKQRQQAKREDERRARWRKALPEILRAIAPKIAEAPAQANGQLADILLHGLADWNVKRDLADTKKYLPLGSSAEDLVRFAAMLILQRQGHDFMAHQNFPKQAAAFGVDAKKILATVAPEPTPPKPKPAAKAPKKTKGKAAPAKTRKLKKAKKAKPVPVTPAKPAAEPAAKASKKRKPKLVERTCRKCGCTDKDCRQCIERTGEPCTWVEPDLCSACVEEDGAA